MKGSLIILIVFLAGLVIGIVHIIPDSHYLGEMSIYILYALMFLVGIALGIDNHVWQQLKVIDYKIMLVPVTSFVGTALGVVIYQLFFNFPHGKDLYAIGAGFGYYSFSGIYISKVSGESMGVIALLANITREVFTLISAPILVKYFGKLAPIAAGGATTSDTTLPVILKYSGKEYVLCSVFNGVVLTIAIPFIISFIYSI
jgi:uncharacterized membrane protein YbjE (DUF340 family)